eukprot:626024-Amphidinium_carterae.1
MWKNTGTCKFGDKCKYSHDNTTAVADEGELSMIATLHGLDGDVDAYRNPGKTEDLTRSAVGLMSEQWRREAETVDEPNNKTNHITSVATLA